mmetsp:Transcript_27389/g.94687  ORF Transcript_27389/g.94687 Transcript_27389/m.94687 type:complete len:230 (-) Transcript_27389:1015-1704(-)
MPPSRKITFEGLPVFFSMWFTPRCPIWPETKPQPTHHARRVKSKTPAERYRATPDVAVQRIMKAHDAVPTWMRTCCLRKSWKWKRLSSLGKSWRGTRGKLEATAKTDLRLHADFHKKRPDDHPAPDAQQPRRDAGEQGDRREFLQSGLIPGQIVFQRRIFRYSFFRRAPPLQDHGSAQHEPAQNWHGRPVPEPKRWARRAVVGAAPLVARHRSTLRKVQGFENSISTRE